VEFLGLLMNLVEGSVDKATGMSMTGSIYCYMHVQLSLPIATEDYHADCSSDRAQVQKVDIEPQGFELKTWPL
jgi:hypothetical protein